MDPDCPNLYNSSCQRPRIRGAKIFKKEVCDSDRLCADRLHLGTAFLHRQLVSSLSDPSLPYLFSSTIRSGCCSCCGKIHQEVIIFNVSENFLWKAITVFLNHGAVGQAQVCCIPLNHSVFESIWLSFHLFPPTPSLCQRKRISQTYSPHPARYSFRNPE